MSESKWKQIVGKAISEGAYVSNFELRDSYLKAMKLTTIPSNGNGKVSKLSEQITELTDEKTKQGKIINALVQDSTKKDLELEKQNQEIKEINFKLMRFEPLINFLSDHPNLPQVLNDMSEGGYVYFETENTAPVFTVPRRVAEELMKHPRKNTDGEEYITFTPKLIKEISRTIPKQERKERKQTKQEITGSR
jgi:hypothetical protein